MATKNLTILCIILYPLVIFLWFWRMSMELHRPLNNPIASALVMFVGLLASPASFIIGYGFVYYFGKHLLGFA